MMTVRGASLQNWLISFAIVLGLLVLGQALLVPFLFAVLLWSVLNALAHQLQHLRVAPWLSWCISFLTFAVLLYVFSRILLSEAQEFSLRGSAYLGRLDGVVSGVFSYFHLPGIRRLNDLVARVDVASVLGNTAVSVGNLAAQLALVAMFAGFLFTEQRHLPKKLARLVVDDAQRTNGRHVVYAVAQQIRIYLGVCTLLSAAMAAVTYLVLRVAGIEFAGFWALLIFVLTYIPTIGGVAVVLPAMMALVQGQNVGSFLEITLVLGATHFVLANVVQTVLMGRTLNLSPLAIIGALTFWGLIWGVAGLFLAVPLTAAIAICCDHIDGARWVSLLLSASPAKE